MIQIFQDSVVVILSAIIVVFVAFGVIGKTFIGKILWIAVSVALAGYSIYLRSTTGLNLEDTLICKYIPGSVNCDDERGPQRHFSKSISAQYLEWREGGFFEQRGVWLKKSDGSEKLIHSFATGKALYRYSEDNSKMLVGVENSLFIFNLNGNRIVNLKLQNMFNSVSVTNVQWLSKNKLYFQVSTNAAAFNINDQYIVFQEGNDSIFFSNFKKIQLSDITKPIFVELDGFGSIERIGSVIN
jgi:hypothetical protein